MAVTQARGLGDEVVVAHLAAKRRVPVGPVSGAPGATMTLVLKVQDVPWRIAAAHNTRVAGTVQGDEAPPVGQKKGTAVTVVTASRSLRSHPTAHHDAPLVCVPPCSF